MNHMTSVRNRKHPLRMVQELDAFPKVPESYQETTATGGGSMYLAGLKFKNSDVLYVCSGHVERGCNVDWFLDCFSLLSMMSEWNIIEHLSMLKS